MRIDPEAVYLEITESALVYNHKTGKERHVPAATLHFKDGRKWRRVSFFGDGPDGGNGQNLEAILGKIGAWIDKNGLDAALAQITEPAVTAE